MSSERHPQKKDDGNLLTSIYAAGEDVEARLDDIIYKRWQLGEEPDAHYDWTILRARELQLRALSDIVLGMAKHGGYDTFAIDENDFNVLGGIEMPDESFFADYPTVAENAWKDGEGIGANDFLEILVPDDVTDKTTRGIYYYPWKRTVADAAMERGDPSFAYYLSPDESLSLYRPTRVPNINVEFYYPPNQPLPQRKINITPLQSAAADYSPTGTYVKKVAYERRIRIIRDIGDRVDATIEEINQQRLVEGGYSNDSAHQIDYVFLSAWAARLRDLSDFVLSLSRQEDTDSPYYLDDPDFIERMEMMAKENLPRLFPNHSKAAQEAVKSGETAGTNSLLDLLVPDTIIDTHAQDSYFFPWSKGMLHISGLVARERADGFLEVSYDTRLPNIEVVHTYAPDDHGPPMRMIRLKNSSS